MEQLSPLYGAERRRLRVAKLREVRFRGGYHDMRITTGGVVVFPRLIAAEHEITRDHSVVRSGIAELDQLLGGGFSYGTSTLIMGPAGSSKSSLATHYATEAARQGAKVALCAFDESLESLFTRSAGVGLPLRQFVDSGHITIRRIDPAEMAPGEFAHAVCAEVEERGARMVIIDSLNGYRQAMPEEQFLTLQLHELLSYLGQRGVATIMVMAQHGLLVPGEGVADLSYLADNVILLRYFEARGRVRRAISVMKKRSGNHENTIREIALGANGFQIGKPLAEFSGVLSGTPRFVGLDDERRLLDDASE
jgi:circadian clock protein KaiC